MDECVRVEKSQFAKLKVSLEGSWLAADKTLCGDPTGILLVQLVLQITTMYKEKRLSP